MSREDVINKISKIIDSRLNSKEGLSLAITGNWGVGKSYVLNVLEKKYQNQSILFHYDCWKNDFYEEPLIAILSCISRKLNSIKTDDYEDFQKQYYSAMKEIVFRLSQAVINNFVGFDFDKIRKSFFLTKDIFRSPLKIQFSKILLRLFALVRHSKWQIPPVFATFHSCHRSVSLKFS